MQEKILIIGGNGQVGTELIAKLRSVYSSDSVIATDIQQPQYEQDGPFEILDAMDFNGILEKVKKHKITQIYQLAALLSATAEKNPDLGWRLNMEGLLHVLNIARDYGIKKVFWPSSIAVFGPNTPRHKTPQHTIMDPNTVYGISKLAGERWCEYYFQKFGVDVRSLRYPGLISYKTAPGGGTTDYAIHIFYDAIKKGSYKCFLNEGTHLPMLYMPDAIKATVNLMEAPAENISIRSSYNLAGFSFAPEDIAAEIKKLIPGFSITYEPDFRQKIANSWPASIDDSQARSDWNWQPDFTMAEMVADMMKNIREMIAEKQEQ
jgi:nucleoside-diphosphate-sugar epimerase